MMELLTNHQKVRGSTMNIITLGIDIAKNVFHLHGTNVQGKTVLKKRLRRDQLHSFMQTLPPCRVGMEACGGAHYWARKFQSYGHTVKPIAPQYVKPCCAVFVKI